MKQELFTVLVTRKEFLQLPMVIRRRALKAQADKYIDAVPKCQHGMSFAVYCGKCADEEMNPEPAHGKVRRA